jgi:hypothetical protein
MTKLLLLIFTIGLLSCVEKEKYNPDLKTELSSILTKDQGYRELFGGGISEDRKSELLNELEISEKAFLENERELFRKNDSLNLVQIEAIIDKHGYPGKSLVGEPENEAAWFVIQHSNKIENYFPIIKEAGAKGELDAVKVAMMEDRMLMLSGKEQIYGTQGKAIFLVKNPLKQEDVKYVVWPIRNPEKVNELRAEIGFKTSVEENSNSMNIQYQVYTLKEVKEMSADH